MQRLWFDVCAMIAASVVGFAADDALARQVTWDGGCGGSNWHAQCGPGNAQTNWNNDMIPTSGDLVVIPAGAPVVSIAGALGLAQMIACQSGLSISSGGQLALTGTSAVSNLALVNGSVVLQTPTTILELQGNSTSSAGTIIGPGILLNAEHFSGQSFTLQSSAQFENHGEVSFTSITCPPNCTITNFANLTLSSGTFGGGLVSSGMVSNNVGGTITTQHTNMPLSFVDIQPFFNLNNGIVRVVGPSTALGTRFHGGGNFTGQIEVLNNAHLRFQGPGGSAIYHLNNVQITGDGNVYFELPSFEPYRVYVDGPVLADVNSVDSAGGLVLYSGVMVVGDPKSGGAITFTNAGKAFWRGTRIERCAECFLSGFRNTSADFTLHTGAPSIGVPLDASFVNEAGATFNHMMGRLVLDDLGVMSNAGVYRLVSGDISPVSPTVAGVFSNSGLFIKPKDPATQDSIITAPFDAGSGVVLVDSHTLTFNGGALRFTADGNVSVGEGAYVVLTGGMHRAVAGNSTIDGLGEFRIEQSGTAAQGGLRVDAGARLEFELGNVLSGGLLLAATGRMGGSGEIKLSPGNEFRWNGGSLGVVSNVNGEPGPIDAHVTNEGTVVLRGGSIQGPQSRFVNEAIGGIGRGVFQIDGSLTIGAGSAVINRGDWRFSPVTNNVALLGVGGAFINEGEGVVTVPAGAPGSGASTNNVAFTNQARVVVQSGGRLTVSNITGVADGKLTEGQWIVEPGGTLITPQLTGVGTGATVECNSVDCPAISPKTNDGTLRSTGDWTVNDAFRNSGTFWRLTGDFSITGDLENNGGTIVNSPSGGLLVGGELLNTPRNSTLVNNGGLIDVQGDIENGSGDPPGATPLSFIEEALVLSVNDEGRGDKVGFFCANLNNRSNGELRPGGSGAPGPFHVTGNLNLFLGGSLQIELNGLSPIEEHDQMIVNGDVALGGTLRVVLLPGYEPEVGAQFTIMTVTDGAISGQFDEVTGAGQYSVTYHADSVILTVDGLPVPGDINGDGAVNVSDLLAVINSWGICPQPPSPCAADIAPAPDGDGNVNVLDLLMVINNWG